VIQFYVVHKCIDKHFGKTQEDENLQFRDFIYKYFRASFTLVYRLKHQYVAYSLSAVLCFLPV